MDPKDPQTPQPKKPESTVDDLHAEGVDIVGSGVSEENEFSQAGPESAPAPQTTQAAQDLYREPVEAAAAPFPPVPTPTLAQDQKPAPAPAAPFSAPAQPQAPEVKNDPSIKPIRTFKSDAEEAVRYKNVSAVDIALAEQKKREATATPIEHASESRSGAFGIVLTLAIVIIALVGGWYYWFSTSKGADGPVASTVVATKTIVPYSKGASLRMDGVEDPIAHIASKLSASSATLGTLFALIPTTAASSTTAPIATILAGTSMPSKLSRSLAPEYMIGSYSYETQSPFIILKTTYFQNAFAGMLEWEKDLYTELMPLVLVAHPDAAASGAGEFEDAVVSNIDARAVKGSNGEVLLAYAFADNDTIVIATSGNALRYLLDRILTVRTIQ